MIDLERIEDAQIVSVHVNGPSPADRLYIFTGSARFDWHVSDDENWSTETLLIRSPHFRNPPAIYDETVVDHAETGSLGSIYSRETARRDAIGFSVRQIDFSAASREQDFMEYSWNVHVSLRGNDVHLYRVNFQFTVLASHV